MDRAGLYRQLALNRHLLELAEARFTAVTDGLHHPRIDTARNRLRVSCDELTYAAGGLSAWTRTWLGAAVLGVAAFAAAAIAGQLIGLRPGWTVTVTVAVVLALVPSVKAVNNALADRVNRRRTKRPEPPVQIIESAEHDPAAVAVEIMQVVHDKLATVMSELSTAHRFGHLAKTAEGFDWLRRNDPALLRVSVADRSICQAIDSIEIWRSTSEAHR